MLCQKTGQDDEIDGNIVLPRRQNFLPGALTEKQQLSRLKGNFPAVGNVGGGSAAHIDHLHIVVAVFREMGKPGVGPNGNQPATVQKLLCINDIRVCFHIDAPLDLITASQQCLFLRAYGAQKEE